MTALQAIENASNALNAADTDAGYARASAVLLHAVADLLDEHSGHLPATARILKVIAAAQTGDISASQYKQAIRHLELVCDL